MVQGSRSQMLETTPVAEAKDPESNIVEFGTRTLQ